MRTRYMPEHLFNIGVVTIVRAHLGIGKPLTEWAATLAKPYRQDFIDDGFEVDLVGASTKALGLMQSAKPRFEGDTPDFQLRHMQFFFSKYNIDGSRKRWRLLNGTRFTGEREPVKDRQARFVTAYLSFIFLTTLGKVPLPPPGWRL